jgi:hypothetical protein
MASKGSLAAQQSEPFVWRRGSFLHNRSMLPHSRAGGDMLLSCGGECGGGLGLPLVDRGRRLLKNIYFVLGTFRRQR